MIRMCLTVGCTLVVAGLVLIWFDRAIDQTPFHLAWIPILSLGTPMLLYGIWQSERLERLTKRIGDETVPIGEPEER